MSRTELDPVGRSIGSTHHLARRVHEICRLGGSLKEPPRKIESSPSFKCSKPERRGSRTRLFAKGAEVGVAGARRELRYQRTRYYRWKPPGAPRSREPETAGAVRAEAIARCSRPGWSSGRWRWPGGARGWVQRVPPPRCGDRFGSATCYPPIGYSKMLQRQWDRAVAAVPGREIVNSCGLAGLVTRHPSGLRAQV